MKIRDLVLLTVIFSVFCIFVPDMVPGKHTDRPDDIGCSLVDYSSTTTLPEDFPNIQDPKQRKQVLIDLLLPLVLKANESILAQRHELQRIEKSHSRPTPEDRQLIEELARAYLVEKGSHETMLGELLVRVDVLPASLVLAQAAIESGWGTSRFALKGNNVFGLRGPAGLGMIPGERNPGCGFSISTFGDLQECIDFYLWNINTRAEYERLRKLRTHEHTHYDPLLLAQGLDSYSEMGQAYVQKVVGMIRENNLKVYDSYRLKTGTDERTARISVKSFKPASVS